MTEADLSHAPLSAIDAQRDADAAYFEDWSEWSSLDGRPHRPTGWVPRDRRRPGPVAASREGWCAYWCHLSTARRGFLLVAASAPIRDMIRDLPGARHDRRDRYDVNERYWFVPVASWRAVRAALPAIQAATITYLAEREAREVAAMRRLHQQARRP